MQNNKPVSKVAAVLFPESGSHQVLTHSSYFNALEKSTEISGTPSVHMEVLAGLGPWHIKGWDFSG